MSDLTDTRDHLRKIANWEPPKGARRIGYWCRLPDVQPYDHAACQSPCACECHPRNQPPSDSDRALAKRLADEIDDHLNAQAADDGAGLWEDQ